MQKCKSKCLETNVVFYGTIAHASVLYQEISLPISFICSFIKAFLVLTPTTNKMSKSFSVYNLPFVQIFDGDNFILVQSHVLCLYSHLDRVFHDKNVVSTAIWLPE